MLIFEERQQKTSKHTHTAFVVAFNEEFAKLLSKPMDVQELQDPGKVLTI